MGAAVPRLCCLHVHGGAVSLAITVVAPSLFVLHSSPFSVAAAMPRLKVCLACLSPGALVALATITAFSGTLVVLSCPL